MILLAVIHLGEEAYGCPSPRTRGSRGRNVSVGSVYAALERLEAKDLVSSTLGDPTPERAARPSAIFGSHAPVSARCMKPAACCPGSGAHCPNSSLN